MTNRAVFLDKDGTLVHDVPYNADPARIALMHGALEGLASLAAAGYELVVVSNQSGVARGYFPEAALRGVERRLQDLVAPAGVQFARFYFCPHLPEGSVPGYACECVCRKPRPGLVLRAAAELELDLERSWLIGDILHDIEAGRRAGCRTVLLDNGHETEWDLGATRTPDIVAVDLREAADRIIEAECARAEKRG